MEVHLIDGTYELFRYVHALPSAKDREGREVTAVRGVVPSVLGMVTYGATHIAIATDHVIESSRKRLWPGYKTGDGIDPDGDTPYRHPALRGRRGMRRKGPTPRFDAMAAQLDGRGNPAVAAKNLQPQAPE